MNAYDIGDLIELKVTFTNSSGVATDPLTATITVRQPDGTETSFTGAQLTHTNGTGIYTVNYSPTVSGQHTYYGIGVGTVQSAEEGRFYVKRKVEGLCTIADLEYFLQVTISNIEAAEEAIVEATAAVRNYTRQTISRVANDALTLTIEPYRSLILLPELPVISVASVVEDGTTLAIGDDYRWTDYGRLTRRGSSYWNSNWQEVVVTYTHGYATIPDDVKAVCARSAARRYQAGLRAAASSGVAGVQAETIPDYAVTYSPETGPNNSMLLGASAAMILLPSERGILDRYRVKV